MDRTRVQVPRNLGLGGALVWRIGKQRPVSRKKSIVIEIVNKILDIVIAIALAISDVMVPHQYILEIQGTMCLNMESYRIYTQYIVRRSSLVTFLLLWLLRVMNRSYSLYFYENAGARELQAFLEKERFMRFMFGISIITYSGWGLFVNDGGNKRLTYLHACWILIGSLYFVINYYTLRFNINPEPEGQQVRRRDEMEEQELEEVTPQIIQGTQQRQVEVEEPLINSPQLNVEQ